MAVPGGTPVASRNEASADEDHGGQGHPRAAKIAFLDPRKFFRHDGSLVPMHELDEDAAAGLAGLGVTIHLGEDGEVMRTAKIKLPESTVHAGSHVYAHFTFGVRLRNSFTNTRKFSE